MSRWYLEFEDRKDPRAYLLVYQKGREKSEAVITAFVRGNGDDAVVRVSLRYGDKLEMELIEVLGAQLKETKAHNREAERRSTVA